MNYRALEDLIGILVKKSGFKLSDLKVEEDTDFLEDRKKYIEGEIESLKSKLNSYEYINKDERYKDEEERKYLEDSLNDLNNSLSELETKLSDKSTKSSTRRKLLGDKTILEQEIANVRELLTLADNKLTKKSYFDFNGKTKDEVNLDVLEAELSRINTSLEIKYNHPVVLGNKLLDAFKENKPFSQVSEMFDTLITKAHNEFDKTSKEIKDSNIFDVIDKYTTKKRDTAGSLEENNYSSESLKNELFEKEKYHNSRLETFRNTLDGIEKRKEALKVLIDESKRLYDGVLKEREQKEDILSDLINTLYGEANLIIEEDDYKKVINELRNEIVDDKYLENKYNSDIQSFKDEVKNLDINYTNISNEITCEERSLEIIHEKLNGKSVDLMNKFQDKVNFLVYSNRVENLGNEQQYLYVNVDVIKDEVMSIWNKGEDAPVTNTSKGKKNFAPIEEKVFEPETVEEIETPVIEESIDTMYDDELPAEGNSDIEVIDYLE